MPMKSLQNIYRKACIRLALPENARLVEDSGLFDGAFYLAKNGDVARAGIPPLRHYLLRGAYEGRDPHPFFISAYYQAQHRHLLHTGENPLIHYIQQGDKLGCRPNPFFDPCYYRTRLETQDEPKKTSLQHYLSAGDKRVPTCSILGKEALQVISEEDILKSGCWLKTALASLQERIIFEEWVKKYDEIDDAAQSALRDIAARLDKSDIKIHFLIVNDRDPAALDKTITSLKEQLLSNWDCFIDNPNPVSSDLSVDTGNISPLLEQSPQTGKRVFLGILRSGTTLAPHYTTLITQHLLENTAAKLIFCDEDTIESDGTRSDPVFKPEWDNLLACQTDLFGSGGLIDLRAISSKPQRHLGSWEEYQDFLRAHAVTIERDETIHVPYLIAHNRPGHSWNTRNPKKVDVIGVCSRWTKSLKEAPEDCQEGLFSEKVSIIILTKDRLDLLRPCVESIERTCSTTGLLYEVVIVDNGSSDEQTLEFLNLLRTKDRYHILHSPGPFNFSKLNNAATSSTTSEYLCFLNNDVEFTEPGWLEALRTFARCSRVGAVGTVLRYDDGSVQHGGVVLGVADLAAHSFVGSFSEKPHYMNLLNYAHECSAVTAACLMVRRSLFESVAGFDEEHLAVNFNDVDLCLKLKRAGYRNVVLPLIGIIHHESKTRSTEGSLNHRSKILAAEAEIMRERWSREIDSDCNYNPNLSLNPIPYQLAFPPRLRRFGIDPVSNTNEEFHSQGRSARLNIYSDHSNHARALMATHTTASVSLLSSGLPVGLSVIILNKDAPNFIIPLLEQLRREESAFAADRLGFEVIIGDTGTSDKKTLSAYRDLPENFTVVSELSYHFSRCNNLLEESARFQTVLFMNNDIILPSDGRALHTGYQYLNSDDSTGILGAVMAFPNGSIQHMGCMFLKDQEVWGLPYHINAGRHQKSADTPQAATYPAVTGAFLMMQRELFRLAGRFDQDYKAECQDVALCLQAHRLGYRSTCVNLGPIVHIENGTRPKGEEHWGDRRRFLRHFGAYIRGCGL
jgi:GT2 family glycosyltransferase